MDAQLHTEGPWEVGLDRRGVERVFAGNSEIVRALSEHGKRRLPARERKANRDLIAAGPDMLAALKQVVDDWQIASETWRDSSAGPATVAGEPRELREVAPETVGAVVAAIAKAEGRS